jgi:2,5-diketo-D-gluconate reductase A
MTVVTYQLPNVVAEEAPKRSTMSPVTGQVPDVALSDGVEIPQLGFGVMLIPQAETAKAVLNALEAGYRHIDTASVYGNEAGVGEAFRASGLPRSEVFITTKCFNDDHGYEKARAALRRSLARIGVDQVDLYLIHWPLPARDQYVETWRALIDLQQQGLARSIGVSNFQPDHLQRVIEETGVTPAVNQVELHPRLQQAGLRRTHERLGIATAAWSPLARGGVLDAPTITRIAGLHGKTAAQVVIRWHLEIGNLVIPKSATPTRIVENLAVFDFTLSDDELAELASLETGERLGPDPDSLT